MEKQAVLPGQEPSFRIGRETFKKDGNWLVVIQEELGEHPIMEPGDNFHLTVDIGGGQEQWCGTGICTHFMSCFVLDIPKFVLDKHHDPSMKNGLAMYEELQRRQQGRISPATTVYCIGFKLMAGND